ncbi:Glutathione S-transferase mu 2 [Oopsacas minuta]|uniref:glutathione transferase n=1 Tax=Oopsacas minuta TaxID=111878 RepID=A0AAV7JXP1_9METZ|nr:Glutathione S-transferase mu 2 [Oopsacas minuta]
MAEVNKVVRVLGYWKTRGIAQQIRLLLEYTNTPYEEILYKQGDPPEYDKSDWFNVKYNLGLDFPNLPYYIDGDYKLTESNAITRYIADKNDLVGKSIEERGFVSMIENVLYDWHVAYWAVSYDQKYTQLLEKYLISIESKFIEPIVKILNKNIWLAGDELTYVDFIFYEIIDTHFLLLPVLREKYPLFVGYANRFGELPAIKAYMTSSRFLKYPINSRYAGWGGIDHPIDG